MNKLYDTIILCVKPRSLSRLVISAAAVCVIVLMVINLGVKNADRADLYYNHHYQDESWPPEHKQDPALTFDMPEPKGKHRILCIIFTTATSYYKQARPATLTWAGKCDKHHLFYSKRSKWIPAIGLDVEDGFGHLTEKVIEAFKFIHSKYPEEEKYDWIVKAHDDTYVKVGKLRQYLEQFNSSDMHYIGHAVSSRPNSASRGYMSPGPGYVFSKATFRKMISEGIAKKACTLTGAFADANIGACMEKIGAPFEDAKDVEGRDLFLSMDPGLFFQDAFRPPGAGWARKYSYHLEDNAMWFGRKNGRRISPHAISFHKVSGDKMLLYDFLHRDDADILGIVNKKDHSKVLQKQQKGETE